MSNRRVRSVRIENADEPIRWAGETWANAPSTGAGQRCGFCDSDAVAWVHMLDQDKVWHEAWGENYSLSDFFVFCDRCEVVFQTGDVESMVKLINPEAGWDIEDVDEDLVKPVKALIRADLGRRPLR